MNTITGCRSYGWLDSLAIGMSIACAIHCLITPIALIVLPLTAASLWTHENFHMWMLAGVIPTTSLAMFMGCKKHKDRTTPILSIIGMAILVTVAVHEVAPQAVLPAPDAHCADCASGGQDILFKTSTIANIIGGLTLASAHVRNYIMCRKSSCNH